MRMGTAGWVAWLAVAIGLGAPRPAVAANGVVGPGNCNESGFDSVLAAVDGSGGGTITFNCGTVTLPVTHYKQIANAVVIDGGGTVTLDGGNASPLFQVYSSARVTLGRISLQHGINGAAHAIENFGILVLDQARVLDNVSNAPALMNYGTLVVRASTLSGNHNNGGGDGGAIDHQGAFLRIDRATFSGNSAVGNGGAIHASADMTITNSTFSGNTASGGGAIYQAGSGVATIVHATIAGNSAGYGAGIYRDDNGSGTLTIARSLLAGNSTGNCDGVLTSGGYNLSSDNHCGGAFTAPGDLNGQALAMGALANNGGPTQTLLPQAGNPAINHVPAAACSLPVDQRGGGRPFAAGCDSGAVETGAVLDLIFYDGLE